MTEKKMTPEEAFDRQILSGNYRMFLIVGLFLIVGVVAFVGLMSAEVAIGVAVFVGSVATGFLAGPLFWETDSKNRTARRLRRAAYFPIRKGRFILSKWKMTAMYGGVLWMFCLAIQLVFGVLFGFANILLFQCVLAAALAGNLMIYTVLGTVGICMGE